MADTSDLDSQLATAAAPLPLPTAPAAAPVDTGGPSQQVNVVTPEGELVSIPSTSLSNALQSGYTAATQDHIDSYVRNQKYGSVGQQAITALEGAGEAATFGLSTGAEKALGVDPEDIAGRREENPISHTVGQVAGLGASAFVPGLGEANLLGDAAKGAAAALGLGAEGAGIVSRLGSGAVKGAVETGLFQAGDEVSKMFTSTADPSEAAQTALTNVGLSTLIGAGGGALMAGASPLWKATISPKIEGFLNAVKDKVGGIEGQAAEDIIAKDPTQGFDPFTKQPYDRVPPPEAEKPALSKAIEKLKEYIPGSALDLAHVALDHLSPTTGFILRGVSRLLGHEAEGATKIGLLKFVGSDSLIDPEAFGAAVDFAQQAIKGENLIGRATKNVLKAGVDVLPASQIPNQYDRDRLDKKLQSLQEDASPLTSVGGKSAGYMPEQGAAVAQMASSVVNYVNSQRPDVEKKGILDTKPEPTPYQKAQFNQVLNIAQQPLTVLQKVQDGTVAPSDVQHLNAMYPTLYGKLQQKLMNETVAAVAKGNPIPYKTRLSMSVFTGQPLDSTMTPTSIMAAQPQSAQGAQQPGQAPSMPKHSTAALAKLPQQYQTATQSAQADRSQRG